MKENELVEMAVAAVEEARNATGAENDMVIKVGTYTNDFGSWLSAEVRAASALEEAETAICRKFYSAAATAQTRADFDAACDIIEAFKLTTITK